MDDDAEPGARFARLLAAERWVDLADLLAPDIAFAGLTPRRGWSASTPGEVVTAVLRRWFDDRDHVEALLALETGPVADRRWLRYRLRVRNDDGVFVVEQTGYYDVDADGRIARLQLLCAGFRRAG